MSWPPATHGLDQRLRLGRAAARVDVAPVGIEPDRDHARAERHERVGRDRGGGAVGAVEHDADPAQVEPLEALGQGPAIAPRGVAAGDHRAEAAGRHRRMQPRLDLGLLLVGELVAVGAEELDPVVAVGVVRGRDHGAEVEAVTPHGDRRRRRRGDAAELDVDAGRRQPGGQRRLEHRARLARVAHDQRAGARAGQRPGGAAETERELGGQDLAGRAAHAVGAEVATRSSLTHRQSRVRPDALVLLAHAPEADLQAAGASELDAVADGRAVAVPDIVRAGPGRRGSAHATSGGSRRTPAWRRCAAIRSTTSP